jgi:hypothetical protein
VFKAGFLKASKGMLGGDDMGLAELWVELVEQEGRCRAVKDGEGGCRFAVEGREEGA